MKLRSLNYVLLLLFSVLLLFQRSCLAESRVDRLGVFVLNTNNENLTDTLYHLDINISPWTPVDVYVICTREHHSACVRHVDTLPLNNTPVAVRTVEQTGWGGEEAGMDASRHRYNGYSLGYRLMGDWRMWHMQHYAKELGYRYILQLDTDSSVRSNVSFNIVQLFKERNIQMGCQSLIGDLAFTSWGLAELIRFYLLTEDIVPDGTLFDQCEPHNINGLYSKTPTDGGLEQKQLDVAKQLGMPEQGGWGYRGPYGNFVILDLELWLSPPVQRFVKLCRVSGASMHFRWNEQSVYGAIWQIFVSQSRTFVFDFMTYIHWHG